MGRSAFNKTMKLFLRFWYWLTKPAALVAWLGSLQKPVPKPVAAARMAMCRACPNSVHGGKVAEAMAESIEKIARMKGLMGLKLENETDNFCAGCGCKISLKVWVSYAHIKAYQRQAEADRIRTVQPVCWQL